MSRTLTWNTCGMLYSSLCPWQRIQWILSGPVYELEGAKRSNTTQYTRIQCNELASGRLMWHIWGATPINVPNSQFTSFFSLKIGPFFTVWSERFEWLKSLRKFFFTLHIFSKYKRITAKNENFDKKSIFHYFFIFVPEIKWVRVILF